MKIFSIILKSIGVLLGVFLAIAVIFAFGVHRTHNSELLSTRNVFTDEEQANDFYFGPVVFRIKNRFLQYPFSHDSHPFDASKCGQSDIPDDAKNLCGDRKRSVTLQIPVSGESANGKGKPFTSGVVLDYRQMFTVGSSYFYDESSVEEFSAEKNPSEGRRERVQTADTDYYAGVLIVFKDGRNGPLIFVAKAADTLPHVIVCGQKEDQTCIARDNFLADEFPRDASGKHPFSLMYDVPRGEIDHAPAIGAAVLRTVAAFPRVRFSPKK